MDFSEVLAANTETLISLSLHTYTSNNYNTNLINSTVLTYYTVLTA